ncbi:MAG: type II toxin-antitoxin system HicA family toxin [Candidatus Nitrosocaldus sp.]
MVYRLPRIGGKDLIKYLSKKCYKPTRQRGSHVVLRSEHDNRIVVVPLHNELDRGTLLAILEQAGIDRESFIREVRG